MGWGNDMVNHRYDFKLINIHVLFVILLVIRLFSSKKNNFKLMIMNINNFFNIIKNK